MGRARHASPVDSPALPADVVAAFDLDVTRPVRKLTGGWTNDTYAIGDPPTLILQRVSNHYVADPQGLMENLVRILSHLEWKRTFGTANGAAQPGHDARASAEPAERRWYQRLLSTAAGKPYIFDEDGSVWRLFDYVPGRVARGTTSLEAIGSVAELYGRFLNEVHDLGGPELCETVAGYRDLDSIMGRFDDHWSAAPDDRQADIAAARQAIDDLHRQLDDALSSFGGDTFVRRPVHNDTKLSNVLLSLDGDEAVAVLDLDVAMHGHAMFDFGDLVRSACWHRSETGADFSTELFDVVADRFTRGAGASLSAAELAGFALAGPRICLELGVRYLTDHLRDEPLLRLGAHTTSQRRGEENVRLAAAMLDERSAMEGTIERLASLR